MSVSRAIGKIFKQYFVSGLLVVVPLIITYLVLSMLFEAVDGIFQRVIHYLVGFYIPGLGIAVTLLLIIIAGILTRNYIGGRFYKIWENILVKIPLIRPLYSGTKGLLQATTSESTTTFKEVVMVEYPRKGSYNLGFVASFTELTIEGTMRRCAAVYLPNTPTPFTGWTIILPIEDVTPVDITVEQAIKFVVSGGVVTPGVIKPRGKLVWQSGAEAVSETR
ncbi:MAG: DUF502 domain-containing protein [candidate division Zixibacteria bacterium]|nr:DUF502 domain-containing protein [candidate division Zixibacteria bacterium]